MPQTFDDIETLIARALENSLSIEEQATLQAWLDADASNRRYYEELRKTWDLAGTADTDYQPDVDKNWDRFRAKIETETPVVNISPYRNAMRIAATFLILAGAGILYFVLRGPQEEIVTTAALEKKEVVLPDGSKVFMNQQSKLRYAKNLAGAERAVYLEGEAFFDVAHEEARPFVVYANQTQTQVLGTTFDVKAYDAQPVEVAVLSGKVAVSAQSTAANKIVLTKGRKAIFRDGKGTEEIAIEDPNLMAWKENALHFNNIPLHEVVNTLESYYNVQIVIEDSTVANYAYTGHYVDGPQLEEVLNVLAASADLTWVKEGNQYKLKKKN